MQNYQTKKENMVDDITTVLFRLDKEIQHIQKLANDPNVRHDLKIWRAEKRAIHDIKHILHDVHKYNRYEDAEVRELNQADYNYLGLNNPVAQAYFDHELVNNSTV